MALSTREQHLLALVGAVMNNKKAPLPADTDWEQLFADGVIHAVPLLVFEGAAPYKSNIDPALYATQQQRGYRRLLKNQQVNAAQQELVSLLEQEGYPYVILKGAAAAAYYPKPQLRALGDVDFLIDPAQTQQLADRLEQAGYTKFMENHACHLVFRKPGAHLEMHFAPAGIPHGEAGELARAFLQDAVRQPVKEEGFLAPLPHHHGLILLLHMQHHMVGEGLGLRHLCDWAAFVGKTHGQPFWQQTLIPFLQKIGLFTYMNIMTAVCVTYLGTEQPQWLQPIDPKLGQQVMEDIMLSGNFGRKDKKRAASGMMVSNHGKDGTSHSKVYYLYQALHRSTLEQHAVARRSKAAAFCLDCGRAARYLFNAARGKRYSPLALMPVAEKRKKLYEIFNLFK